jgi:hypothetical protein
VGSRLRLAAQQTAGNPESLAPISIQLSLVRPEQSTPSGGKPTDVEKVPKYIRSLMNQPRQALSSAVTTHPIGAVISHDRHCTASNHLHPRSPAGKSRNQGPISAVNVG